MPGLARTPNVTAVTVPVFAPEPKEAGTPTVLLSSYIPVVLNLLMRLYLVLPKHFVLFERDREVLVMSSEDRLHVVSFGDR